MKEKWINAFMDTAERFAQLSSAVKLQVGSVVVKDNRIISIGYNGTPSGWDNACEDEINQFIVTSPDGPPFKESTVEVKKILKTKDEVIHAEANAITKLARDGESGAGSTLFCTHAPCVQCAKLIYGAGITSVYFRNHYRNNDGLEFLEKCLKLKIFELLNRL